jgi:hypothetical protein
LNFQRDEARSWKGQAVTLKTYNTVLKNSVKQLKSGNTDKYREQGRREAESEMLSLLTDWNPENNDEVV